MQRHDEFINVRRGLADQAPELITALKSYCPIKSSRNLRCTNNQMSHADTTL